MHHRRALALPINPNRQCRHGPSDAGWAGVDGSFPSGLFLEKKYGSSRAVVIGPVHSVDNGVAVLVGPRVGVSVDLARFGPWWCVACAGSSCVQRPGGWRGGYWWGCSQVLHSCAADRFVGKFFGNRREPAEPGESSAPGALPDPGGELLDVVEHFATLSHLGADLLLGVHHRGVVAAESLPDLG